MSQENFTADPQDVQANKVMAILAYFGLFVLIPLFAAKESPFVIKSHNELSHYSILFLSSNTIFINFCFSKNTLTLEY